MCGLYILLLYGLYTYGLFCMNYVWYRIDGYNLLIWKKHIYTRIYILELCRRSVNYDVWLLITSIPHLALCCFDVVHFPLRAESILYACSIRVKNIPKPFTWRDIYTFNLLHKLFHNSKSGNKSLKSPRGPFSKNLMH